MGFDPRLSNVRAIGTELLIKEYLTQSASNQRKQLKQSKRYKNVAWHKACHTYHTCHIEIQNMIDMTDMIAIEPKAGHPSSRRVPPDDPHAVGV